MPEEVNRILTDRVSRWLFCPTQTAVDNLSKEGYPFGGMQLHLSGDVMQDAALFYAQRSAEKSDVIKRLGLDTFVLCTIHRAENTDDLSRLRNIADALAEIHRDTPVVCPLHPRTRKLAAEKGQCFMHSALLHSALRYCRGEGAVRKIPQNPANSRLWFGSSTEEMHGYLHL